LRLLSDGDDGNPGISEITVIQANNKAAVFSERYLLRVIDCNVVDENEDGINEPGEHITIKDLVVENYGKTTRRYLAFFYVSLIV
jgi:hypothetical protein